MARLSKGTEQASAFWTADAREAQAELDRLFSPALGVVGYCHKIQAATRRELSGREQDAIRDLNKGSPVRFYRRGPDAANYCPHAIQVFRPQTGVIERFTELTDGAEHEINRVEFAIDTLFAQRRQSIALGYFVADHADKPWPGQRDSAFFENKAGIGLVTDSGKTWSNRGQNGYADRPSRTDNETPCYHHKIIFSHAGHNRGRGLGTFAGILEADIGALYEDQFRLAAIADPAGFNADIDWWLAERAAVDSLLTKSRPQRRRYHGLPISPDNDPDVPTMTRFHRSIMAYQLFGGRELPDEPIRWHTAPIIRIKRLVPEYVRKRRLVHLDVGQLMPRRRVDPMPGDD